MASIDKGDIIGTLFIDFQKPLIWSTTKLAYYPLSITSLNWF